MLLIMNKYLKFEINCSLSVEWNLGRDAALSSIVAAASGRKGSATI